MIMNNNNGFFVLGKIQSLIFGVLTEKYDHMYPIKITKNRPENILKDLLEMMKNEEEINDIMNFISPYLV